MAYLRRGIWLAVFVGALVGGWHFAGNNAAPVRVDYVVGVFGAVPLWLALLASFGIGAAVTAFALFARLTRSSLAGRRYRKTVAALESEVHQLRNLPVEAERDVPALLPAAVADAGLGAAAAGRALGAGASDRAEPAEPADSADSSDAPDSAGASLGVGVAH